MPSPTSTGRAAEQHAADHLERQGFEIIDRNWRNRWCELDIVATHGSIVHFVEVKYRASAAFGLPAEYINYDKSRRLIRAALAWNQAHRHAGAYQIDIISLTGDLDRPAVELLPNAVSA